MIISRTQWSYKLTHLTIKVFSYFLGQNMVSESSIQIQTSGEGEVDDRTFSKQPGKENKDKKLFMCHIIIKELRYFESH